MTPKFGIVRCDESNPAHIYKEWGIFHIESFENDNYQCRWFKGVEEGWYPREVNGEVLTINLPSNVVTIVLIVFDDYKNTVFRNVYMYWQKDNYWKVGRYCRSQIENGTSHFIVKPEGGGSEISLSIEKAHIRWNNPSFTPLSLIKNRASRSPILLNGRKTFLSTHLHYLKQYQGFTGISSSGAQLYSHQIKVVHTVLTNSNQRFILADEVGLGKTVEVDMILRQWYLDGLEKRNLFKLGEIAEPYLRNPLKCIIVVPEHLLSQWKESLSTLAGLSDLIHEEHTIEKLINEDDELRDYILLLSQRFGESETLDKLRPNTLVVDEAHIYSQSLQHSSKQFQKLQQWSQNQHSFAQRVLLLSATPVLDDQQGYFAMLHLLAPETYPDTKTALNDFYALFEHRRDISELLNQIDEDSPAGTKNELDKIVSSSPKWLSINLEQKIIETIEVLEDSKSPQSTKQLEIRTLIEVIKSSSKLDSRILRSTRSQLGENTSIAGRYHGPEFLHQLECQYLNWANAFIQSLVEIHTPGRFESDLDQWVKACIQKSCGSPYVLRDHLKTLPECLPNQYVTFVENQLDSFPNTENDTRVLKLSSIIKYDKTPYAVVMVSHSQDVTTIKNVFKNRGDYVKIFDADNFDEVKTFISETQSESGHGILIVTKRAEMGLNLEEALVPIIHFDLPMNVSRIEQRIGRMDRITRQERIENIILLPNNTDSIQYIWYTIIINTMKVFSKSIAAYENWMKKRTQQFLKAMINNQSIRVSQELLESTQQEFEEYAEELEFEELFKTTEFENLFQELTQQMDADENNHTERYYSDLLQRYVKCLELNLYTNENNEKDAFSITVQPYSIIPDYLLEEYSNGVITRKNRTTKFCLSRLNSKRLDALPLRPGHPIISLLQQYMFRSDRGVASTMIRKFHEPVGFTPGTYIELSYISTLCPNIEFQTPEFLRKCMGLYPPTLHSVWLRLSSNPRILNPNDFNDEDTMFVLEQPYKGKDEDYADRHVRREVWNELYPMYGIETAELNDQIDTAQKIGSQWASEQVIKKIEKQNIALLSHFEHFSLELDLLPFIKISETTRRLRKTELEHLIGTNQILNHNGSINPQYIDIRLDHARLIFLC